MLDEVPSELVQVIAEMEHVELVLFQMIMVRAGIDPRPAWRPHTARVDTALHPTDHSEWSRVGVVGVVAGYAVAAT